LLTFAITEGHRRKMADHGCEGTVYAGGFNNWLRADPNAPYQDRLVAQGILDDLNNAMGVGP